MPGPLDEIFGEDAPVQPPAAANPTGTPVPAPTPTPAPQPSKPKGPLDNIIADEPAHSTVPNQIDWASRVGNWASRAGDIPGDVGEMFGEGAKTTYHALTDPAMKMVHPNSTVMERIKGLMALPQQPTDVGLGLMQMLFSPVMAPVRSMVSRPVEEKTGIPKEVTEAAAGLLMGRPRFVKTPRAAPIADALESAADNNYTVARSLPIEFEGNAISDIGKRIADYLKSAAGGDYRDTRVKKVFKELKYLEDHPNQTGNVGDIEAVRKNLGRESRLRDPVTRERTESAGAASRAIAKLDEEMASLQAGDIAKNPHLLPDLLKEMGEARGNYAAFLRTDLLGSELEFALLGAASSGKGGNIENQIRQHFKNIYKNPNKSRMFNEDELKLIKEVAEGNGARNLSRTLGMAAPTGIVPAAGGQFIANLFGGNVAKVLVPLFSWGAKKAGDVSAHRAAEAVAEVTARRSPLAQSQPPTVKPKGYMLPIGASHPLVRKILGNEEEAP